MISTKITILQYYNYIIISSPKYQSIVAYDLHALGIQTSVSILCDPKRSSPINIGF